MATYEELIAQRDELDRQIEAARHAEQAAAIETVKKLVKQFRFTAEECGFKLQKLAVKQKQGVPIKFRGPTGETWSGRGRPPGWLVALEGQGSSRAEFKVNI
jgi:DNA-binding protein H-NS